MFIVSDGGKGSPWNRVVLEQHCVCAFFACLVHLPLLMYGCAVGAPGCMMRTYARRQPRQKVQLQNWLSPPTRRQHIFSSSGSSSGLSSSLDRQDSSDSDYQPIAKRCRKRSVAAPMKSVTAARKGANYRQGKNASRVKKMKSRTGIQTRAKRKEHTSTEEWSIDHQGSEDLYEEGKENGIPELRRSNIKRSPLHKFITNRRKLVPLDYCGQASSGERSLSFYRKVRLRPIGVSRPAESGRRIDNSQREVRLSPISVSQPAQSGRRIDNSPREVPLKPDSSASSAEFYVLRRKPWARMHPMNGSSTLVSTFNSSKMTSPRRGSIRKPPLLSSTPNVRTVHRNYLASPSVGGVNFDVVAEEGVLNSHLNNFEPETDMRSCTSSLSLQCQSASPKRKDKSLAPFPNDLSNSRFSDSKSVICISHSTFGKSCTQPMTQNNAQSTPSILFVSAELFSATPGSPNSTKSQKPLCLENISLDTFQRNFSLQPVICLDSDAVNRYFRTSKGVPPARESERRQALDCSIQDKQSRQSPNVSGNPTWRKTNTVESKPLLDMSNGREEESTGSGHLHTLRGEETEGGTREASCGKTLCSSETEGKSMSVVVPLCSTEKEIAATNSQMLKEQKDERMVSPPFVGNSTEEGPCATLPLESSTGVGTGRKVCISGFSSNRWGNRTRTATVVNQNKKTCPNPLFRNQYNDVSLLEYSLGRRKHKEKEVIASLGLRDSTGTLESILSADFLDSSFLNSSAVQNLSEDSSFLKDTQRYARLRAAFSLHKRKKVKIEAQTAVHEVERAVPPTPSTPFSHHKPLGLLKTPVGQRLTMHPRSGTSSMAMLSPLPNISLGCEVITDAEKVYEECMQDGPISFSSCISPNKMNQCVKIGEGVFGEVFRTVSDGEHIALKIIPIEGSQKVNGEAQKTFGEILPEIIISKELSLLCEEGDNVTVGFIKLHSVHCVKGSYPKHLLQAWDKYDQAKGSDNDRPDFFGKKQLFIILAFEFGGSDLENMKTELSSVLSAKAILHQVTAALAVAEEALCFEHRDLHWGNILVKKTNIRVIEYKLRGSNIQIPAHNIEANIIDYTLSRLEKDGLTVFCDLSADDELFQGTGDYQFEMYRLMKKENGNTWSGYHPHSNVLWLHYVADKLINEMRYRKKHTTPALRSTHKKLLDFHRKVLECRSAREVLQKSSLFQ